MSDNFIAILLSLIAILLLMRGVYETFKLDVSFTILGNTEGKSVARVIFFSDLHAGYFFVPKSKIRNALTKVKADAILFGGDLTNSSKDQQKAEKFLKMLNEIAMETSTPVFAVLGNHDKYALNAKLSDFGITLLQNENVHIKTSNSKVLQIVGLEDIKIGNPSYEKALNAPFCQTKYQNLSSLNLLPPVSHNTIADAQIILAHNPDVFFTIPLIDSKLDNNHYENGDHKVNVADSFSVTDSSNVNDNKSVKDNNNGGNSVNVANSFSVTECYKIKDSVNIINSKKLINRNVIFFSNDTDIVGAYSKSTINHNTPRFFLCGHFHGGQIWMPFNFEFKLLRREKMASLGIHRGAFKLCGIYGYITRGLGCVMFPLRFLSSPEISILEIKI